MSNVYRFTARRAKLARRAAARPNEKPKTVRRRGLLTPNGIVHRRDRRANGTASACNMCATVCSPSCPVYCIQIQYILHTHNYYLSPWCGVCACALYFVERVCACEFLRVKTTVVGVLRYRTTLRPSRSHQSSIANHEFATLLLFAISRRAVRFSKNGVFHHLRTRRVTSSVPLVRFERVPTPNSPPA